MADDTDAGTAGDLDEGGSATDQVESNDSGSDAPSGLKLALNAERKQRRELEKSLNATSARLKELEDRDKSEVERASERVVSAERERDEARAEAAGVRREGWLLGAASSGGFIDPGDVTALLAGEEIESADDAKRAVTALAEAKPHLVGRPDGRDATPGSFGGGQRGSGQQASRGTNADMNEAIRGFRST